MISIRSAAFALLLCVLAGCGGGGGGSDSGGPGANTGDGLTVSPTSLTFTSIGNAIPASLDVAVTVTNPSAAFAGAAYGPGITPATWLGIETLGAAPNYTFRFRTNPSGMATGSYSTTVSIGIAKADGSVIAHRDVSVTLNVTPGLALSPSAFTFNYALGAAAPANQALTIGSNGSLSWTASANQPWITLSAASGTTPSTTSVGVNTAGMTPGTYSGSVTVTIGPISRSISVTLTVTAPNIAPSATQLSFTGINGATLAQQSLNIALNNGSAVNWTATSSAPWLVLGASTGTTPQAVAVSVDASKGPLASGNYTATIEIASTYSGVALSSTINVSLALTPATLSVSAATVALGGTDGSDANPTTLQLGLTTGTNAFPWSVTVPGLAAQIAPTSGTISGTPTPINFQPSAAIAGGVYSATATFSATVNGDVVTRQVPITVRIKPHRIFADKTGVALTSSPTLSKLSHQIAVRDNRNVPTAWSAVSDQPWLTLTNASGTTPATFQLDADPTTLPAESISYANVTVTSTDAGVVNTETIRVGLYRTAASPAAQTTAVLPPLLQIVTNQVAGIVADPIRPYVYLSHGNAAIDVYNIYTGTVVRSYAAGAGSLIRSLAVSDDGGRLFAADHGSLSVRVIDLNAASTSFLGNWTDPRWLGVGSTFFADLDYTRINGRAVLIGGGIDAIDASNGEVLVHGGVSFFGVPIAATISGDGSKLFLAGLNSSGHTITRKLLNFNELDNVVTMDGALSASKDGPSRGLSTNFTGSTLYRACWYQDKTIERYNGTTLANLSVVASGTNGGVILGADGNAYCARYYSDFSAQGWPDVWAVDPSTGSVIPGHEYNVTDEVLERQFVISGDGLRLLIRSESFGAPAGTLTSRAIAP